MMQTVISPRQRKIIRLTFAINILAAGLLGLLIVTFPNFAERFVLAATQDAFTMGIVGSIWLTIGAVSVLGLVYPQQLAPVFLIQIGYKAIWILTVAIPLMLAGDARALPFIIFFSLAIALFVYALPFNVLFQRKVAPQFVE